MVRTAFFIHRISQDKPQDSFRTGKMGAFTNDPERQIKARYRFSASSANSATASLFALSGGHCVGIVRVKGDVQTVCFTVVFRKRHAQGVSVCQQIFCPSHCKKFIAV